MKKVLKYLFVILLIPVCCVLGSCKKASFTTVKVTYAVKVKAGNTVSIECYNDYYFANKTLKPVTWVSNGSTWTSNHYVYEQEDYYIKVTYIDSTKATEDNYKVQVFYNDTTVVQSSIVDHALPTVEFKGTVQ